MRGRSRSFRNVLSGSHSASIDIHVRINFDRGNVQRWLASRPSHSEEKNLSLTQLSSVTGQSRRLLRYQSSHSLQLPLLYFLFKFRSRLLTVHLPMTPFPIPLITPKTWSERAQSASEKGEQCTYLQIRERTSFWRFWQMYVVHLNQPN